MSDSSLYTFSQETKDKLRKFRLGTSRAKGPSAVIYEIDKNTHEIRQDEEETTYKSLEEIADELPDNSPRFILLSYPMTLVPYVMIYYMPTTCNAMQRMLYVGAKEVMRGASEATKTLEIESPEEILEVPARLGSA